jgi:hypothetical protein
VSIATNRSEEDNKRRWKSLSKGLGGSLTSGRIFNASEMASKIIVEI